MARSCTVCGKRSYSDYCVSHKPRAPLKQTPLPPPKRRIKQRGKEYAKWRETKEKWFETHKAPYYFCHYCGKMMTRSQLTLDHKIPRSRAPELRHAKKNLVPCCWACNSLKGSVAHDDYAHNCQ